MTIKLTPAKNQDPANVLRLVIRFMHGDADAYTYAAFDIKMPETDLKEQLIDRILKGVDCGLDLLTDTDYSPFVIEEFDWNSSNQDSNGIPLVGSKIYFVHEVQHKYWKERRIDLGTVVDTSGDETVSVEFNGSTYVVPIDENNIAPETAIPIFVDGMQCKFTVDGVDVSFETQGDCTCDGSVSAYPSLSEVFYFDENGNKFIVSNFSFSY